jgi:hypothetical protein
MNKSERLLNAQCENELSQRPDKSDHAFCSRWNTSWECMLEISGQLNIQEKWLQFYSSRSNCEYCICYSERYECGGGDDDKASDRLIVTEHLAAGAFNKKTKKNFLDLPKTPPY